MKLGYIIIRPKQKYSTNSGLQRGNRLQKKQKLFFRLGKWWRLFWDSHGVILIDYLQKGKTITGAYYASLLDKLKAELGNLGKTATFAKKENPVSHLSCCHDENPRIAVGTAWPSVLFTRSNPKRLLFVPSCKNCAQRTEIFVKWRGNHLREQLFCRENRRVLFGRVTEEMGASLGEVCYSR